MRIDIDIQRLYNNIFNLPGAGWPEYTPQLAESSRINTYPIEKAILNTRTS